MATCITPLTIYTEKKLTSVNDYLIHYIACHMVYYLIVL
jgi:hypothetical protein